MKPIRVSPAAEASLSEILHYSLEHRGLKRAEAYKEQLLRRIHAVARGGPLHPRPCETLMQSARDAAGLCYRREGSHYIILRQTPLHLEIIECIHQNRDLERLIEELSRDQPR